MFHEGLNHSNIYIHLPFPASLNIKLKPTNETVPKFPLESRLVPSPLLSISALLLLHFTLISRPLHSQRNATAAELSSSVLPTHSFQELITSSYHYPRRQRRHRSRPRSRVVMRTFRSPSSPRCRRRSPSPRTRSARWRRGAPESRPRRATARWCGRSPWRRSAVPPCAV